MAGKATYWKENRLVIYMNPYYSKIFRAIVFDMFGTVSRGNSICGFKFIKQQINSIPKNELDKILKNYEDMLEEELEQVKELKKTT